MCISIWCGCSHSWHRLFTYLFCGYLIQYNGLVSYTIPRRRKKNEKWEREKDLCFVEIENIYNAYFLGAFECKWVCEMWQRNYKRCLKCLCIFVCVYYLFCFKESMWMWKVLYVNVNVSAYYSISKLSRFLLINYYFLLKMVFICCCKFFN